jgi:predicted nucleotide-binding protein (sugar kinase/HSP70/actin superfamily)
MIKVGIPRALLYYQYYPLWRAFLTELGTEVVLSPPTNKQILDSGLKTALSEACLPVKLYFGHVLALAGQVDYIFTPRVISVEQRSYICPKFMGLPDMLQARLSDLPPLLSGTVDARQQPDAWSRFFTETAAELHAESKVEAGCLAACRADQAYRERLLQGVLPGEPDCPSRVAATVEDPLRIGILGHPYNLYDSYINQDLLARLAAAGVRVVTPESVDESLIAAQLGLLPKRLFWTLGKRVIGSAMNFFERPDIDGVIYLTSFGCGPESMVGELVERRARRDGNKPFMKLTIDEHSGEAGLVTRIEAFTDMIKRRNRSETHLSAHG